MAATEAEANKPTDPEVVAQEGIEDDEHDSKERVLQRYFLQEWTLLKSLLNDIVSSQTNDHHYLSSAHKIRSIVDKYQEQGQLLEPYLDTIVPPLMSIVRSKTVDLISPDENALRPIKCVAIVVYALVTVCGYKSVTRFFPHHVSDLELAVSLMERCHVDGSSTTSLRQESTGEMEAKCVVLLWLSILVLVPFDLSTVDSSVSDSDDVAPLVRKILEFSKDYLSSAGPMRSIAGLVLSRLLTRPDMPLPFSSFVEWTNQVLTLGSEDVASHFRLLGVVEALAALFKVGGRKMLIDVVPAISNDALELFKSKDASRSPLLRKYLVKLMQRIGLVCLPHRTPTWRYVGRTRSLGENVCSYAQERAADCSHGSNANSIKAEESENHLEDEDMDVPEIVEEIIEMLLCGLRDTDTVVRWSAAKGIGRLTSRLTSSLSEEVLTSVLELFSPGEGDGSWHGACLALAELARRGLLLPISLPKVLPFIEKALHYDVRRGPHSVGSHVRDAAAYVCWAFGRAYYHSDMRNVLDELAPHLLTVACYDREVNCRRAAAAAFQENVGRQGSYPHGIDIVNTADYFALASRVNSYLQVAVSVAQYEGYLYPFAEELLHNKICHWDKGLRELSALAISALVKYNPDYFANFVLVKLIPCTLSSDLCTRHGATLAAGEVVLALHQCDYRLSTDMQKNVAGVVPAIEKARLYRGKGGEIMRAAVSRFIECVSLSRLALPERNKRSLLDSLNENLRHPNSHIQNAAVKALKHFIHAFIIPTGSGGGHGLTSKYLEQLSDQNVAVRRGSALALGVLPSVLFADQWKDVLLKLCSSCAIEHNPEDRDAEARVNAIKGVILVCETLHQARGYSRTINEESDLSLYHVIKNDVMAALLKALDDYSVDNRGDVGSWVREAAMEGLGTCTHLLCTMDSIRSEFVKSVPDMPGSVVAENNQTCLLFDTNLATNVIGGIVKQAVEKMDKLREVAAKILQRILYNDTVFVPLIPHREKLLEIVPNELNLKWAVPSFSYPRFVQLLQFSCYSKAVLSGLVISIGGLQDSLRMASISALLDYLQADETGDFTWRMSREYVLSSDVLWVLQQYKKNDRVIIPTLKTIEILFSRKIFLNMEAHTSNICAGVVDALAVELKGSKDFSKLYSGIAILGYIAPILDPISYRAFSHLLTLLSHRYPKIRKAAAEQVYLVLLQNGNLLPVNRMEKALEIISETCWDGDLEVAKHQKLELCEMAGLGVGQFHTARDKLPSNDGTKLTEIDENASYSSLVGSTGF